MVGAGMADGGDFRYHYQPHLLLHQHHLPQQQRQRQPPRAPPRQRPSAQPGEIVEVQGGHILRATGRKDRHSKVCTAKGPRDRRVRLSAHTAIQFYDVQDRLGYDRPSKAVDWLIKHAKSAIDELASLPSWRPPDPEPHAHQQQQVREQDPSLEQSFAIVPPSLESDAIADTIKLFFPVSGSQASFSHSNAAGDGNNVVGYPQQDLRLSLQPHGNPSPEQALFPQGWVDQSPACVAHWAGAGGYIYSVPEQVVMGDGSALSQRCPLQSNGSDASIRGWMDVSAAATYHPPGPNASSFGPGVLPGFHVPARIHGEDDQQRSSSVALPLHLLDGAGRKDGRR